MDVLKVIAVIATGLGVTWAAQQWTGPVNEPMAGNVVLAQADEQFTPGADDTPVESDGPVESQVEDLTQEELEAELKRVEEALGDDEVLKEFVPTKPLAADIPIEFPSDI